MLYRITLKPDTDVLMQTYICILLDEKNSVNRYFLDFWKKWEYSSYSSLVPFVSRFHARMKSAYKKGRRERHFMSKNELRSSGERRSAVHDNRMFAKRAFYCIANGASEL